VRGLRTFLVVAFLVCGGLIVASLRSAPHRILLQDVTVIDGTGGTAQQHRDILINGDRIEAVGPTGGLSADGAEQVPLAGRFVTPAFVDMHAHLLNHPWDEKGQIRPRWDRNGVVEMLRMLLDYGVTTVRDPGSETEAAVT
jgi:imidazolonepropionase-like amidohydrolase